jgi:hypothetical protein
MKGNYQMKHKGWQAKLEYRRVTPQELLLSRDREE